MTQNKKIKKNKDKIISNNTVRKFVLWKTQKINYQKM